MIQSKKLLGGWHPKLWVGVGGVVCVIGFGVQIVNLSDIYSSTDCIQQAAACPVNHELFMAKLGNILIGIGLLLVLAGVVHLLVALLKQKRQRQQDRNTVRR